MVMVAIRSMMLRVGQQRWWLHTESQWFATEALLFATKPFEINKVSYPTTK
jgi:hypothetical protein